MAEHDYKASSVRAREEKRPVKRVVKGDVKRKRKSDLHKVTDIFISEDAPDIKEYVIYDVIIPVIKDTFMDSLRMLLYGERGGRRYDDRGRTERISYNRYSDRDTRRRPEPVRSRTRYTYDDVVIPTRGEAEEVLMELEDRLATYGMVSVADFYEAVGIESEYTDNKYGWFNLSSVPAPVRVREGYIIKFPKARPLD